jgi:WbqC-like protein family
MIIEYKIIIENQIFPVVNSFKYLFKKEYACLFPYEGFERAGFCNRYIVAGSNGLVQLSVPLAGGRNQKRNFRDVPISYNDNWQLQHWRTLESCYNKSPFFEYYREDLKNFFAYRQEYLFDLNLSILFWLKSILKFSAEVEIVENVPEGVEDLRNKWSPRNFQKDECLIKYPQVFEEKIGFQKNLSILDLLFNVGPEASELLKKLS